jgi:hypothetical protein
MAAFFQKTSTSVPHGASRIAGRGRLLRSLRLLVRRVDRFCCHRARTEDERLWAARLADQLDAALTRGLDSPAAEAGLAEVDRRAIRSQKTGRPSGSSNETAHSGGRSAPPILFQNETRVRTPLSARGCPQSQPSEEREKPHVEN